LPICSTVLRADTRAKCQQYEEGEEREAPKKAVWAVATKAGPVGSSTEDQAPFALLGRGAWPLATAARQRSVEDRAATPARLRASRTRALGADDHLPPVEKMNGALAQR
jgi:hypothetical protein